MSCKKDYNINVTTDDGTTETVTIQARKRPNDTYIAKCLDYAELGTTSQEEGSWSGVLEKFINENETGLKSLVEAPPTKHSYSGYTFSEA
jgi:hypothetical protein